MACARQLPVANLAGKAMTPQQLANIERGGIEDGCTVTVGTSSQAQKQDSRIVQLDGCKTEPSEGITVANSDNGKDLTLTCLKGTIEQCAALADKLAKRGAKARKAEAAAAPPTEAPPTPAPPAPEPAPQ